MVPGVGTNLVSLLVEVLDGLDVLVLVDTRPSVSGKEESRLRSGCSQGIADVTRVDVWAVVQSQRDGLGYFAVDDDLSERSRDS